MNTLLRIAVTTIFLIGSIISVWFLIANLQSIYPASYLFVICVILFCVAIIRIHLVREVQITINAIAKLCSKRYFIPLAIAFLVLISVLARFYFYFKFSYLPSSDPVTFVESAQAIAGGEGIEGSVYVALFPYLSAYNNTLALFIKLIEDPWLATIVLNTSLDLLSAAALYYLIKIISVPGSKLPLIGFAVWILNPLNIIFSVLSLPIAAVNFFIIITLLVSHILITSTAKARTKNALFASVLLGLIIGTGSWFRPIFVIVFIALILVFLLMLAKYRSFKTIKISVASLFIVFILFMILQIVNLKFISNQIGLQAAANPSGWSLYVGSDFESSGQWREYMNQEMSIICRDSLDNKDYEKCHDELKNIAIDRYKSLGIGDGLRLFINKLYHQAHQQNYFYNAEQSIVGFAGSTTSKVLNMYTVIYILVLYIFSAIALYKLSLASKRHEINYTLLFLALLLIGWFISFMFVESAPRYSTILYPLFTVFSIFIIGIERKKISASFSARSNRLLTPRL